MNLELIFLFLLHNVFASWLVPDILDKMADMEMDQIKTFKDFMVTFVCFVCMLTCSLYRYFMYGIFFFLNPSKSAESVQTT